MIRYISSFFWKEPAREEASLTLDEAYNILNECEDESTKNESESDEGIVKDIAAYEVCSKIGKITEIKEDTYTIDGIYTFKSDLDNFLLGTKVSYNLIKSPGEIKVGEVQIIENDWDVVDTHTVRKWYERTLVCTVSKRDGRNITVMPGEIGINLNEVRSAFIPVVGDWLELDIKCEVDETVVDFTGKILEINKILPLRPQIKLGKVTQWNSYDDKGTIDRNIFFTKDSLYCGYLPARGDQVVAEIIESNQGMCTWRALKIIPDYLHSKRKIDTMTHEEDDYRESSDIVTVTDNICLTFTKLGECKLFTIEIESQLEDIQLVCIEIPKFNGQCRLTTNIDHHTIKAKQILTITCECKAKSAGESREIIIFHFNNCKIRRWITIQVASLTPSKPSKFKKNNVVKNVVPRAPRDVVIRGQKPKEAARFISFSMPEFPVPERLQDLVTKYRQQTDMLKSEVEKMKPCLVTPLTYMNFEDRFHTLLHLDEIHAVLEMQNYDQERACFVKSGEYLLLEVENLAEKRPSVVITDRVIALKLNDPKSPQYEGYIHKISKNHLHIKFSQLFHNSYDGEDYAIYIVANRATYKRAHYAVNLAVKNLGSEWLFPTRVQEKEPQLEFTYDSYSDNFTNNASETETCENKSPQNIPAKNRLLQKLKKFEENGNQEILPVRKLEWFNKCLNYYQKEAVRNVLLGVCRPLPYIIFGPPGTGKTVTLVETVLQILRLMPHSRLLIAAPSNSAADLIALRLIDSRVLKPGDLVRLVAITAVPGIPARLAPYCATANLERVGTETSLPVVMPNGLTMGYSSAVLGRHRITVTTCSCAGTLYQMGFSKGHFSHIIVDEAGQTTEPSVLIPLSFLDTSSGQAILAGDPLQLGPVILSRLASDYGLEESFMERMVSRFPYMRDSEGFPKTYGFDPRLITKLIYNYRSLPDLLKLPSSLFYNDDLKATISSSESKEASILQKVKEMLPQTKDGEVISPIVFHGVKGENYQDEDSPSWLNPHEAAQVFYYVNELYRLGLTENDIGIITPYKAQVKQFLDLFKEADFNIPKVGTVEEFQGQEFNVILVSTVRSNHKFVSTDNKYHMGFISSPRRLNVSITRAKALLIVVGNPKLLATDRFWRSVIHYCRDKGSFIGSQEEN